MDTCIQIKENEIKPVVLKRNDEYSGALRLNGLDEDLFSCESNHQGTDSFHTYQTLPLSTEFSEHHVQMETEEITNSDSAASVSVTPAVIPMHEMIKRELYSDEIPSAVLQGLLDTGEDVKEHDLGFQASARAASNDFHHDPQSSFLQPEAQPLQMHNPEVLTTNWTTSLASSNQNSSDQGIAPTSASMPKEDNTLVISQIGPDVYQFGNFPVQAVDGKHICLTCARTFGGKQGRLRMSQHVKYVHMSKFSLTLQLNSNE